MSPTARLILASESPRRRELLSAVGIPFRVIPSGVDETPRRGEPPARFARRAARDKGTWVAERHPGSFVLSADTIVVAGGKILGKPRDRSDARRMLSLLAGIEHKVYTAVSLLCPARGYDDSGIEMSRVRFRALTPAEVAGSFTNVVGLPMTRVVEMLQRARLIRVAPGGASWYAPAGRKG